MNELHLIVMLYRTEKMAVWFTVEHLAPVTSSLRSQGHDDDVVGSLCRLGHKARWKMWL